MKKLYLLATLALVAFVGNAGNEAMIKSLRTSSPVSKEIHRVVKADDFKVMKLEAAKKAEKSDKAEATVALKQLPFKTTTNRRLPLQSQAAPLNSLNYSGSVEPFAKSVRTPLTAPVINELGIIEEPDEGVHKYYQRVGGQDAGVTIAPNSAGNGYGTGPQSGVVEIVETESGDVYIKDPISSLKIGSWVKGTKSGNKITVPTKQPIGYSSSSQATASLRWATYTGSSIEAYDSYAENFTFTIQADGTITLDNSSLQAFMAIVWNHNDKFAGYGDYGTTLTEIVVEPKSHELVELPAGYETEKWILQTLTYNSYDEEVYDTRVVNVAVGRFDVYVQGLYASFPEAWVKGDKIGDYYDFEPYQYLGQAEGADTWAVGVTVDEETETVSITSFKFLYSAEDNALLAEDIFATTTSEFEASFVDVYFGAYAEKFVPVEFTAPYIDSLNTILKFLQYQVIDVEEDGKTWAFDTLPYITYNSSKPKNDWLISPAINLTAGQFYSYVVDAATNSTLYPERFVVKFGKEPTIEGLTTTLLDTITIKGKEFETYSSDIFTVPETGKYYVGIQAVSDEDMFKLIVKNAGIVYGVEGITPGAVENVTLTPFEKGKLEATLQFDAPSVDKNGEALTGDVNVIVELDGAVLDTITTAAGTKAISRQITVAKAGTHTIVLTPYVIDNKNGKKTRVSAWIGPDVPGKIEELAIYNQNTALKFQWPAVASLGENEGYVDSTAVTYNLYTVEIVDFMGYQFPTLGDTIQAGIVGTEYALPLEDLNNSDTQESVPYAITASNESGEGEETYGSVLVGKPYELPVAENFDAALTGYWDYDSNSYGSLGQLRNEEGGYGLALYGKAAGGYAYLSTGMISLEGTSNPTLGLDVKSLHGTPLKIFVETPAGDLDLLESVATTEAYTAKKFNLTKYNSSWVRFYFVGEFLESDTVTFDNFVVIDLLSNNLSVALSAPQSLKAGSKTDLVITVTNIGEKPVSDYAVKVYAADKLIDEFTKEETAELSFYKSAEFVSKYETSIFDEVSDVTLRAEVVFAADEDTNDNADEVEISVVAPAVNPLESLSAHTTVDGIAVVWEVAENKPVEIVEDFESYEDQIVTDNGTLGPWLGYDVDKGSTYGWESSDVNWEHSGESFAFAVWTPAVVFNKSTSDGYANGSKSALFMSVSPDSAPINDDWMISPELSGNAQTISFKVTELTNQYGNEEYEVYYSTTDREIASFTKVASGTVPTPNAFTEVKVDLPAGAKYFAIHYVSKDVFGFIVDDIAYEGYLTAVPTGFNIYVNEELVATVAADATSYNYNAALSDGDYKVSVTAVFGDTESLPASTNVAVTAIEQIGAEVKAAEIYNLSGLRVRADKQLKSGVYVIDGKKTSVK